MNAFTKIYQGYLSIYTSMYKLIIIKLLLLTTIWVAMINYLALLTFIATFTLHFQSQHDKKNSSCAPAKTSVCYF